MPTGRNATGLVPQSEERHRTSLAPQSEEAGPHQLRGAIGRAPPPCSALRRTSFALQSEEAAPKSVTTLRGMPARIQERLNISGIMRKDRLRGCAKPQTRCCASHNGAYATAQDGPAELFANAPLRLCPQGRRAGQQRHAPPAVGTDAVAARCHANHHRVTPTGTREPFQNPLAASPPPPGGGAETAAPVPRPPSPAASP